MLWHKHWTYEGQVQQGIDPIDERRLTDDDDE